MQFQLSCVSHLLLLAVLAGHSLAVFYTKGKDTDYPRIGRRSFYTSGSGNHYPRIGRRASGGAVESVTDDVNPRLLLLAGSPERASAAVTSSSSSSSSGSGASAVFSEFAKRGVFTQGRHGYPRVGRRSDGGGGSAADLLNARRHHLLERLAEFKDEAGSKDADPALGGDDVEAEMESAQAASHFPLEIMFMAFDNDGDGKLSKDEFGSGMRKYRQQNPLC